MHSPEPGLATIRPDHSFHSYFSKETIAVFFKDLLALGLSIHFSFTRLMA